MQECVNCGRGYAPGQYEMDDWLCRECQRSPAVQVRVLLNVARGLDATFEQAWGYALGCAPYQEPDGREGLVRWPHDTDHRTEWKRVFADADAVDVWRSAYAFEAPSHGEERLTSLVA